MTTIMDDVEASLEPQLRSLGFRHRKRTFTRTTPEGLAQVINLQMGRYDPPGTVEIPGFRENLHGRFTVNLGVYVPEVAEYRGGPAVKKSVQEADCCFRTRLGMIGPEQRDLWWDLSAGVPVLTNDVMQRLSRDAFTWFDRFATRDSILAELGGKSERLFSATPRIVSAIIHAKRGNPAAARALLDQQIEEAADSPHAKYVRELTARLGL